MVDFLWTAPLIIFAAFLIAWGAEATQYMVSQGLALAILAWLQTLPEFAVEANIAWHAARGTEDYSDSLVTANFTGSIRLLMGFGMPIIYFIHWFAKRKREPIELDAFHSVEVVSLFPPVLYFLFIVYRGRLDLVDSVILLGFYVIYLVLLLKMPPEQEGESIEELPFVARKILKLGKAGRIVGITLIFVLGGFVLYICVHPFINSLQAMAVRVGISGYFFIQWIAPFLSEFPEKVSAFNWARQRGKAKLGLMNFCSSNINQMTMLVAMIPIVYCVAKGDLLAFIDFRKDEMGNPIEGGLGNQQMEILLTALQAALCMLLLFNLKFQWWDAVGMFVLWVVQFSAIMWEQKVGLRDHFIRDYIIYAYFAWIMAEVLLAMFGFRRWRFPFRLRPDTRGRVHKRQNPS